MAGPKKLTLRVQSSEGTSRVELMDCDPTAILFERVYESLNLNTFAFTLHKDRQRKEEITSSKSRLVRDYGLQHGDMLYLSAVNGAVLFDQPTTSAEINNKPYGEPVIAGPSRNPSATPAQTHSGAPVEDEVDLELYSMSGSIQRQRDEKLCRHNSKGSCVHCSPLEPWDEGYLKDHNIKHMSFHSYLRKITSGKFVALEELSFNIKPDCREHPPWPRGSCSKCAPASLTLRRQAHRHVDNVLFEHPALVERFLAYWRATGHQRLGWLYGVYERHPDVPLGIRARVCAIYEPAQTSSRDSIQLLPATAADAALDELAARLGLTRVGWIFTDLLPDDLSAGTVKHIRGVETHFLSAQECITAGHYQNAHPNACRYASSGHYGSKFVTVCVTGDAQQQVVLEGYQVSQQCAALVRAGVLLPTRDAPELGYVREATHSTLAPVCYYKERDAYGNEVSVRAVRVPVAYLLVDVPCGVAAPGTAGAGAAPVFTPGTQFPPAHRALPEHLQTLRALHGHLQTAPSFLAGASDLHVLLYMATNEALPLGVDALQPLLEAVRARDAEAADSWRADPAPATLLQLASAAADQPDHTPLAPLTPHAAHSDSLPATAHSDADSTGASGTDVWTCPLCTFHNVAHHAACDMCAMPRGSSM